MRARLIILAGVWLVGTVLAAGCQQDPDLAPKLERVLPDLVAVDQVRYVTVEGSFSPLARWDEKGQPALDLDFDVRVGPLSSGDVHLVGPDKLVFKVPARLSVGCHDLIVVGPGGDSALLGDALCVGDVTQKRLVHGCLLPGGYGLCAFDPEAPGSPIEVLVEDVAATLKVDQGIRQVDGTERGYSFSPDGSLIAFLRYGADPLGVAEQSLNLARLGPGGFEVEIARQPYPSGPSVNSFSSPIISPDGRLLVWIEQGRRVMVLDLTEDPLPDRGRMLAEAQSGVVFLYPDVDVASRFVLVTSVWSPGSLIQPEVSLRMIPLDSGEARPLKTRGLREEYLDGPGVFLPAGTGVLFSSNRLGLEVPSPFLFMDQGSSLYRVPLFGGPVEPIGPPVSALMYGRPQVAMDGSRALVLGHLNDLYDSGVDLLIADLATGGFERLFADPMPFCYPPFYEECTEGQLFPCCISGENGADCCVEGDPVSCPSLELLPAWSPDGKSILVSFIPLRWACERVTDLETGLTYLYWLLDWVTVEQAGLITEYIYMVYAPFDESEDRFEPLIFANELLLPAAPTMRHPIEDPRP